MPGDRVDVLVHLVRNASQDIQETTTRTILQNIKVFAVNDVVDVEQQKDSKDKEKMTAKTISLLVTPAQSATLMLANEMGKVRLIMRSPEDEGTSVDGNSDPSDLLGGSKNAVRENEKLVSDTADPLQSTKNSLTDYLNNMKKHWESKGKSAAPVIPNDSWTMRFLQPNSVIEVTLEADTGPQAAKMPNGAWHLTNTSQTSLNGGAGNYRKQGPPPAAPAANATPAEQPSTEPAPEPAAEPNAEPKPNPPPQETTPDNKTPGGGSGENSPDDSNSMMGG